MKITFVMFFSINKSPNQYLNKLANLTLGLECGQNFPMRVVLSPLILQIVTVCIRHLLDAGISKQRIHVIHLEPV